MKKILFLVLRMTTLSFIISCSSEEIKTDSRDQFSGQWQGNCNYACQDILSEQRMIELTFFKGTNKDELIVEIEFRFVLSNPNVVSEAENVLAHVTEDGFIIEQQAVTLGASEVLISGAGSLKNSELEFALTVPLSLATCDLTGTISRN